MLRFSVTAASTTGFIRDKTKGWFCGPLTEKAHMFSIRALNTEGWQKRDKTIPKTIDTLLPRADLGGLGVNYRCFNIKTPLKYFRDSLEIQNPL